MTPDEPRSIKEARDALVDELRGLEGLTMVGIGERDGTPCLRVYVVTIDKAIEEQVPTACGGWPVELRESGPVRAREG